MVCPMVYLWAMIPLPYLPPDSCTLGCGSLVMGMVMVMMMVVVRVMILVMVFVVMVIVW